MAGVDSPVEAAPRNWLAPRPAAPEHVGTVVRRAPGNRVSDAVRTAAPAVGPPSVAAPNLAALAEAVASFAHPLRRVEIGAQLFTGNADAGIIILCEQPEAADSPAARLRSRMLAAIGLDGENCALLHRLPWPTTGGRAPRAEELAAFAPFVARALELVRPRAMLALGQTAAALAGEPMALASARGRWADVMVGDRAVPLLATSSPRLLLAQPLRKREAWADLQAFAARMTHAA